LNFQYCRTLLIWPGHRHLADFTGWPYIQGVLLTRILNLSFGQNKMAIDKNQVHDCIKVMAAGEVCTEISIVIYRHAVGAKYIAVVTLYL